MQYANIRDFTLDTVKYLRSKEEVCIFKRGKTVGIFFPIPETSEEVALLELRKIVDNAGITKKQFLDMFEKTRKRVYKR